MMDLRGWVAFLGFGLLIGGGCQSEALAPSSGMCTPGLPAACACPGGTSGSQLCNPDGLSFGLCDCGPAGSAGTGAPLTGASDLPCDVSAILEERCSMCHGTVTQFTAPMSLVTWDDLNAPAKSNPTLSTHQMMMLRVQDAQRPMPPAPHDRLTTTELAVLNNWVNGGAPKGTQVSCGDPNTGTAGTLGTTAGTGGAAGTGGDTAGTGAGSGATAGTGGDENVECYDFLANSGDKLTPYAVPTTPDFYRCFYFSPPWTGTAHGVSAQSIIDNTNVIHHWILYSSNTAVTDGSSENCPSGTHNGQFVVGWAPGAQDLELPAEVGLELPGQGYVLEIHYNAKQAGQTDGSGVKLCVTHDTKPNTAATHPLGRELFTVPGAGSTTGTCKPKGPFPITILTSSPHMHVKGTHMKTVVKRAGGGPDEILIDKAFDFNTQLAYDTPMVINAGDTLETTCTYNAANTFGTGTNEEMCYNFVTAYPAGALAGGIGYTGVSQNGNTCINTF